MSQSFVLLILIYYSYLCSTKCIDLFAIGVVSISFCRLMRVKPGFHSNARNALRKEKYASKIKSAQETQQTQENYASKKQKYASASHATDASGPCARKCNDRIDSIFHSNARNASALRAFEWKPGFSH